MAHLVLITVEEGSASSGRALGQKLLGLRTESPARGARWGEGCPLSSGDSRALPWPSGSAGGHQWCGPSGTRHLLTIPPSPSAQSRSHSGGKDQPAASTPAPATELEQHCQLLSPVDLSGSRSLIRGDEDGVSLVLPAILPIRNTYWATRGVPLTSRTLPTFVWDQSCCELCSHHCYTEFSFQHLVGPNCSRHPCCYS